MKKLLSAVLSAAIALGSITAVPVFADDNSSAYVDVLTDSITYKAEGAKESAYAEWQPVSGATKYEVYVKAASDTAYTQIDDELIRQYPNYFRADALGLKAGEYNLKIVALSGTTEIAVQETGVLNVEAYDRSGFAFSSESTYKTGSGAYQDDGTLYDDAQVIYVTADTAKTVTADIVTDSKGTSETFTGIQAIIDAKQKGYDTGHLDVRIIGTIEADDVDKFSSSSEGIQIKGKNSYSEMNITIEGVGFDATVRGFGFLIRNCGNVELRNFGIILCMDDSISLDTDNCNIWIHNMDLFYGSTGGDSDQEKGDGTIDCKAQSTYLTFSYNHFWDNGKSSLCGMSDKYTPFRVTYHHNWFDHSDSRHPRIRGAYAHIYNNYYDGNAKYGVGITTGGSAFVEANYFRNCKNPLLTSLQGTDALGDGTFSGEDGGVIKQYNNIMSGTYSYTPGYVDSSTGCYDGDAMEVSSRDEKLDSSILPKVGSAGYSNFDTEEDLAVELSAIDNPEDVPSVVMASAGRLGGGDFFYEFDDSTEDTNYSVNTTLKSMLTSYTSSLVSVGGTVTADPDTTASSSSQTGVDGNTSYEERETSQSAEAEVLPSESDEPSGGASGGSSGGSSTTVSEYAIKFSTSDISSKSTLSSEYELACSVGTVTILANSDKTVALDTSKGIDLGGVYSADSDGIPTARAIKFTAEESGKLTLTGASGGSDVRTLAVLDSTGAEIGTSDTGTTTTIEIPSAGVYYVVSKAKGIKVSLLTLAYDSNISENTTEATTTTTTTTTVAEDTTATTTAAEDTTTTETVTVTIETTTVATTASEETTTEATTTETTTLPEEPTAPNADDMQYVVSVDGIDKVDGTNGIYKITKGTDEFTVDLAIKNNKGLSAITGYIQYDPEIVQAVTAQAVDSSEALAYTSSDGTVYPIITASTVQTQIDNVPQNTNSDFADVNADGIKTQAQLGKIKIAGMGTNWTENEAVVNSTVDGIICKITFKVVSSEENANTVITYNDEETAYSSSTATSVYSTLPTQAATVIVNTASAASERLLGDVSGDGLIDATDALVCLQYTLNADIITDSETIKAMDVKGDGKITATNAMLILQKALNSDFQFS